MTGERRVIHAACHGHSVGVTVIDIWRAGVPPSLHVGTPTYTACPKAPRRERRGRRVVAPPVPAQHRVHLRFSSNSAAPYELDDRSTARKSPGVTNRTPS